MNAGDHSHTFSWACSTPSWASMMSGLNRRQTAAELLRVCLKIFIPPYNDVVRILRVNIYGNIKKGGSAPACRCCIVDIIQIRVRILWISHIFERDIQIYIQLDLSLFPQHYSISCLLRLALNAAAVVSNLSFSQWPSIPTAVKRLLLRLDTWFEKVVTYLLWIILTLCLVERTLAPCLVRVVGFDCYWWFRMNLADHQILH